MGGEGVDNEIIINNRGRVGRGWKNSVGDFLVLICLTKHNAFFFFLLTNWHIMPIQFNTRKIRNDVI